MKFFRTIIFLLCFPGIFLQPVQVFSEEIPTFYNDKGQEIFIPRDRDGLINPFGYFDPQNIFGIHMHGYINHYLDFTDLICDEEFLETLSEEEFDRVVEFVVWAVRWSVPESRPDLKEQYERDIEELYQLLEDDEEEKFYFSSNSSQFLPIRLAVCTKPPKILLCKKKKKKGGLWNQIKRKSKHFGHWCKKHKKPVIISTVVVGTAAVAILTGGVGGSAAAAVGGGLVQSMDDPPPSHVNKPGNVRFREDFTPVNSNTPRPFQNEPLPLVQKPPLHDKRDSTPTVSSLPQSTPADHFLDETKEEIKKKSEIAKDEITTNNLDEPLNKTEKTFWEEVKEVTKETSAYIAHEALDAVSEVLSIIPEAQAAFPYDHPSSDDPRSYFQESIEVGHQTIDEVFDTSQSSLYESETKQDVLALREKLDSDVTIGWLPPPGAIGKAAKNTKKPVNPVNRSNNHQYITFMDSGKTKTISIGEMSHSGTAMDRGGLTKAGRALQKKTDRIGSSFPKPSGNVHEINVQGQKVLDEILNHPEKSITIRNDASARMGYEVMDIKLPDGRGVRFTKDGKEMICFLEP